MRKMKLKTLAKLIFDNTDKNEQITTSPSLHNKGFLLFSGKKFKITQDIFSAIIDFTLTFKHNEDKLTDDCIEKISKVEQFVLSELEKMRNEQLS